MKQVMGIRYFKKRGIYILQLATVEFKTRVTTRAGFPALEPLGKQTLLPKQPRSASTFNNQHIPTLLFLTWLSLLLQHINNLIGVNFISTGGEKIDNKYVRKGRL